MTYLFSSESVSAGHPDKLCDQISDMILDWFIEINPFCRAAIETMVMTNRVILGGEYRDVEFDKVELEIKVRDLIRLIGYRQDGFHADKLSFENYLHHQSTDIALGVDATSEKNEGAGDQGIMFGYACSETDALMPAALHYAHSILENLQLIRLKSYLNQLGPDAKSQVTLAYDNGVPYRAHVVVLSTQHSEDLLKNDLESIVLPVIIKTFPHGWIDDETLILINPTGRFVIGGPDGDVGLTGRKIIVDTYGGAAPHGGGAFSGKDPTKVDRSAAYMARYIAKSVVAQRLAKTCTIQLSYAIGYSNALAINVDTKGTGVMSDNELANLIWSKVDLSPRAIRETLGLNRPIFQRTATYGHFGRLPQGDGGFSWEKTNLKLV